MYEANRAGEEEKRARRREIGKGKGRRGGAGKRFRGEVKDKTNDTDEEHHENGKYEVIII